MSGNIYAITIGAICLGYIIGVIHEYHRDDRLKCSGWFLLAMAISFVCLIFVGSPH